MISGMRVALFSGNYNYQADGANKALNRLVAYLEGQNIEVLVFSPTSHTPAFEPSGTLISVPSFPIPGRGEYRMGLGLSRRLKQQIKDFNPTLFHLSSPDKLGHSALRLSETLDIPVVASFHTRFDTYFSYYKLDFLAPKCRRLMTKFYARCEHVYAPSPSVGRILQKDGIIGDNLRYWGRGIERRKFSPEFRDYEWRRQQGFEDTDVVLGFVGRLVKEKGLEEYAGLVEALEKRGLAIKAMVVGDGPEYESLRARLPTAVMLGHLSGTALSRAYASCDIFINPSLTETFGNVTLEAMASGVPTVCVNATGSSDLVDHGMTGWLIPSATHPDWISKTAQFCQDHELRQRMGQQARLASANYDWTQIMDNLIAQYYEVTASTRPAAFKLAG